MKKKKRKLFDKKFTTTREEVKKLLAVGFIWEVTYPYWVSDVVMVPKSRNWWQIGVDFTNLNKA